MSQSQKKEKEYLSLNEFLKQCGGYFAREISSCEDISFENQERPDFLFRNNNRLWGIEHISVPLLMIGNGNAEYIEESHKCRTFNRYRLDDGIDRLSGKEDNALSEIENIIKDRMSAVSSFSYNDYISEIEELLKSHDASVYRNNILKAYPNVTVSICFLLDIAFPREFSSSLEYKKNDAQWNCFSRRDYPFTYDFLNALQNKQFVDAFCIIWHPVNSYNTNETRCYFLERGTNMAKSLNTAVWNEFRLPLIHRLTKEISLSLERTDNE